MCELLILILGGNLLIVLCNNYVIIIIDDIPDVYTVEEAVDKLGFGAFQVLISLFAGVIWVIYTHTYV